MIAYLKVVCSAEDDPNIPVMITESGVGYAVVTNNTIDICKNPDVAIWTVFIQDQPVLFGFKTMLDRKLAITIADKTPGVGPRTAAFIVQSLGGTCVAAAILNNTPKAISILKGVSDKTAHALIAAMQRNPILTQFALATKDADELIQLQQVLAALGIQLDPIELKEVYLSGATLDERMAFYRRNLHSGTKKES